MKIGVMSDSHDNLAKLDAAVNFFNQNDVEFVFHAGDFVAPFSVMRLKKLTCDWKGVFGNNDGDKVVLKRVSQGRISLPPLCCKIRGRAITLVHDISCLDLKKKHGDIIIYGHTHKPDISHKKGVLFLNPGETGGWLGRHPTVAIIDLEDNSASIVKI